MHITQEIWNKIQEIADAKKHTHNPDTQVENYTQEHNKPEQ